MGSVKINSRTIDVIALCCGILCWLLSSFQCHQLLSTRASLSRPRLGGYFKVSAGQCLFAATRTTPSGRGGVLWRKLDDRWAHDEHCNCPWGIINRAKSGVTFEFLDLVLWSTNSYVPNLANFDAKFVETQKHCGWSLYLSHHPISRQHLIFHIFISTRSTLAHPKSRELLLTTLVTTQST